MNEAPTRRVRMPDEAQRHSEGLLARLIERRAAMLPSDMWMWAGLGSVGASLAARLRGTTDTTLFIGWWVAPFLVLGIDNKQVKVAGRDRIHAS